MSPHSASRACAVLNFPDLERDLPRVARRLGHRRTRRHLLAPPVRRRLRERRREIKDKKEKGEKDMTSRPRSATLAYAVR